MSTEPFSFKLPISRFDLNLLPPNARNIGSEAFKNAVIGHIVKQYALQGENTTIVTVDDEEISVLTFSRGLDPLNFVLSLLQNGRIEEAVPYLESMVKADPNNVELLFNLGIAYSELGQYDEAVIRLKKAVQLQPSHAHAWTGIGVAYQRMGKPELALEPAQKAVEADPTDGYSHRNLGAMLLNAGKNEEGLHHMRMARKALPHDAQTTFGLASALEATGGEDNLAEADELYTVVIERWGDSQVAEEARKARTNIGNQSIRANAIAGIRPDVMMYILDALRIFAKQGAAKRQQIALEIALKGRSGLDINDPEQKYTLKTMKGKFSGLHLLAIMYAAFQQIDPTMKTGADFSAEYQAALQMLD